MSREKRLVLRFAIVVTLALELLALSGCAQLMGALRRDLDDGEPVENSSPTIGGRYAEHGFLSPDMPESGAFGGSVGHNERDPASGGGRSPGSRSWLTPEGAASNRRSASRATGDDEEEPANAETDPVLDPGVRRQYKNGQRATRADFVDESQNEGSLWASDGQTNYYFTKNKIRGVGDIITINAEADMIRDIGLEARRSLTPREREYELGMAYARKRAKAMNLPSPDGDAPTKDQVASSAAAPARSPAASASPSPESAAPAEVDVPPPTFADVDVSKSLSVKPGDGMLGEIIERYPNGNYKVRATKRIPYKAGPPRFVTVVGVVKGTDIGEDDTVPSGKLYEYRVEAAR